MFKSKRRQIVTPQSEHLKLAGTLAMLGETNNLKFHPSNNILIAGIACMTADMAISDNLPIGMSDEEWQEIARRGFNMPCSDVVADTIVKYHFRRLASYGTSNIRKRLHMRNSLKRQTQLQQPDFHKLCSTALTVLPTCVDSPVF
ncbi:MAG: hypothetical protein IPP55_02740 [Anaerolineales bacterium]|nr:hypothetical protein [Anaerolineales bacterium]